MDGRTLRLPAASTTRARQDALPAVPPMLTLPGAFAALPPGCDQSAIAEAPPIDGVPPVTSSAACGSAASPLAGHHLFLPVERVDAAEGAAAASEGGGQNE